MRTSVHNGRGGRPWDWCRQRSLYPRTTALWVTGLLAFICIYTASAGKPVKPPPEPTPAYDYVKLGKWGLRSWAADINNAGLVVGHATIPSPDERVQPFLVIPRQQPDGTRVWFEDADGLPGNDLMFPLGIPVDVAPNLPYFGCYGLRLSEQGQILGGAYDPRDGETYYVYWTIEPKVLDGAMVWDIPDEEGRNTLMRPLQLTAPEHTKWRIELTDLNDHGEMCGGAYTHEPYYDTFGALVLPRSFSVDPSGAVFADYSFRDTDGDGVSDLVIDLGKALTENGYVSISVSTINNLGDVAGRFGEQPCVIRPREVVIGGETVRIWNQDEDGDGANDLILPLPIPKGMGAGSVSALNDQGQAVGQLGGRKGEPEAVLWTIDWVSGEVTVVHLGLIDSEKQAYPTDLNQSGVLVGYGKTYPNPAGGPITETAFLGLNAVLYKISELVSPDISFVGLDTYAMAINDLGLFVGSQDANSTTGDAFVMIPKPSQ